MTPNSVQVTVIGNEQELENLSPSSLIVQVSAKGLGPGTYQLPLTVILPANMEWTAVDPPTVTLTLERNSSGRATPEIIATASPGS